MARPTRSRPRFLLGRHARRRSQWFADAGGQLPTTRGLDAHGILEAAAAGKIEVLVILGSDPVADFPDADLARRGIAGVKHVIAIGGFLTGTSRGAEVVLPPTLAGEKTGSITNLEGRVQRVNRNVAPEGGAMDDWLSLELAHRPARVTCDRRRSPEAGELAPRSWCDRRCWRARRRGGPARDHHDEVVLEPVADPRRRRIGPRGIRSRSRARSVRRRCRRRGRCRVSGPAARVMPAREWDEVLGAEVPYCGTRCARGGSRLYDNDVRQRARPDAPTAVPVAVNPGTGGSA
jgi:hypothetical protein